MAAGTFRGVCKKIDHFPEDADYEQDAAEYLLRKSVKTTHIRGVSSEEAHLQNKLNEKIIKYKKAKQIFLIIS